MRTLNTGFGARVRSGRTGFRPAAGDTVNGEALVFEGKGACLSCHQFNGKGIAVGPDLTSSALTADQLQADDYEPEALPQRSPRRLVVVDVAVEDAAADVAAVTQAKATVTARQPPMARSTKALANRRDSFHDPDRRHGWQIPLLRPRRIKRSEDR